mgnify:CR=1 FL=1
MSRLIMCRLFKKELPGLEYPPFPGPAGSEIFENTDVVEISSPVINSISLSSTLLNQLINLLKKKLLKMILFGLIRVLGPWLKT